MEEHGLSVFENRELRRIFGSKRGEVAEDWRRLHNEELHNLYSSPNVIRVIKSRVVRWAGHVEHLVEMRNAYKILVGKAEGKRPHRRCRRRWEDNIKTDLREIVWEGVDWIHLAQDRDQWRALMSTVTSICAASGRTVAMVRQKKRRSIVAELNRPRPLPNLTSSATQNNPCSCCSVAE
jgi:hypothetical protein